MKHQAHLLLAAALLTVPQVAAQKVQRKEDPYRGSLTLSIRLGTTTRDCKNASGFLDEVAVTFAVVRDKEGEVTHAIQVVLRAQRFSGWAFLRAGKTFEALIDGESVSFAAPDDSKREVYGAGSVVEQIIYRTERDDFRRIANAESFRFRVLGSRRAVEKCIASEELKKVADLLKQTEPLIDH